MGQKSWQWVLAACVAAAPMGASADEAASSESEQSDSASTASESESGKEPTMQVDEQALPDIGKDQLAIFRLQRGAFFSSDLGVFFTLGGQRGYSNVEPYIAVHTGYDVSNYISLQLSLATGYSSGNPLSANDNPNNPNLVGRDPVVNYSMFGVSTEIVGAIRPSQRFAIEPKLGGGLTWITPALTDPSNPSKKLPGITPQIVGGVDLKYLTLLTDFTAGLSFTAYYMTVPQIVAVSGGAVVRYTF